ncbi:short-chain dehydrogenase/reductase family 16C member 6-like [Paramacrobiotus metropolitanus]|uniref:short-chain dehydrogenase/reductase family 16C member 6-like n=1 Tax=Paramacrobiotus metropolitanus TaxID=2943436 RepID=UPI0024463F79|nr:short-chain dehydrogenase/reductase family 16C member 6-like [Paramacrobiotus metropolitanus]
MYERMAAAHIVPELLYTIWLVIYYILEAVVLSLIPNRMKARKDISDEVVLITGGGHGIGRSLAVRFARLRCRVIILDNNQEWLDEAQRIIASEGADVYAYLCDVSNRQNVYECARLIQNDVGEVSILVNNAGIVCSKYFMDLPDESITDVFRTNTFAHFWTLKAFLPSMMDRNHGHIITIASVVGKGAGCAASGYISSKFAAVGLHEALEMELRMLRRTGIHMTLVCPGLVSTGLFEGAEYKFPRLVPVLDADKLAEDVVDTVLRNGHLVITPFMAELGVRVKSLLPVKACNAVMDFAGATTMLNTFRGRQTTTTAIS